MRPSIQLFVCLFVFGTSSSSCATGDHILWGHEFGWSLNIPVQNRPSGALIRRMRFLPTWHDAIPINFGPARPLSHMLAGRPTYIRIYSMHGGEGRKPKKVIHSFPLCVVGSKWNETRAAKEKQKTRMGAARRFLPFAQREGSLSSWTVILRFFRLSDVACWV